MSTSVQFYPKSKAKSPSERSLPSVCLDDDSESESQPPKNTMTKSLSETTLLSNLGVISRSVSIRSLPESLSDSPSDRSLSSVSLDDEPGSESQPSYEHVPDSVIKYVKFNLSGHNSECMVCETTAHIFGSPMKRSPFFLQWAHIIDGVVAITRSRLRKKGRYKWAIDLHIYSLQKGFQLCTTRLKFDCQYTTRLHPKGHCHSLFSLGKNKGILCLQFQSKTAARPFNVTFKKWLQEGPQRDRNHLLFSPPRMALYELPISEPFRIVSSFEGIQSLRTTERKNYMDEKAKLARDIDALKTTGKQHKIEGFPLALATLPQRIQSQNEGVAELAREHIVSCMDRIMDNIARTRIICDQIEEYTKKLGHAGHQPR